MSAMGRRATSRAPRPEWVETGHSRFGRSRGKVCQQGDATMKALFLLAGATSLSISGCSKPSAEVAPNEVDVVRAADAELQKAVAAKDLNAIVSFYADDAVLMPAAEPLISGKGAIADEWEHILAIPRLQNASKLIRVEASSSNDFAYTMGTYQSRMMGEEGKMVTEPGKWLSVWKKQPDGAWRVVVDTYNTDIPPPDHK